MVNRHENTTAGGALAPGKATQPSGNKRAVQDTKTSPPSKKVKVDVEDDKENVSRPSTPDPGSKVEEGKTSQENPSTPGRVGPIKQVNYDVKPNIAPFKGPKGKKVRKSAYEKEQEYKQFIRDTPEHCFHNIYVCYDKGPKGSPTYDEQGFEMDYHKVADWMKPRAYNKRSMVNGMERTLEKGRQEAERMKEIFFAPGAAPESDENSNYWKDRVSKDLNIPWHKIGVKEFEEWERRGFPKAAKGAYDSSNISEKDRARMNAILSGASLRK